MQGAKRVISWGFIVSVVSLGWGVYTWWEAGKGDNLDWRDQQNRLLSDLIEETRRSRAELERLAVISVNQLEELAQVASMSTELRSAPDESVPGEKSAGQQADDTASRKLLDVVEPGPDPAIGKMGWVYFGKFNRAKNSWDPAYQKIVEGHENTNIAEQEEVTIAVNVGFNDGKPVFPHYESGLSRVYPYTLDPGTKVKIHDIDTSVGWRGFTWAKVEIISFERKQ